MARRRSFFRWLLATPLLLTCWAAPASAPPLRMAVGQIPYFSPALIADWWGFFAAEGLAVEVLPCGNGQRCLKPPRETDTGRHRVLDVALKSQLAS
jgi:NitT/TauT family transport system substrate-binding protein